MEQEGHTVGQSLHSDYDKNACVLSQPPKLTNNKKLQLVSSQVLHTANLYAKRNIEPFRNQENHKTEETKYIEENKSKHARANKPKDIAVLCL